MSSGKFENANGDLVEWEELTDVEQEYYRDNLDFLTGISVSEYVKNVYERQSTEETFGSAAELEDHRNSEDRDDD